jgi:hypothetical protein
LTKVSAGLAGVILLFVSMAGRVRRDSEFSTVAGMFAAILLFPLAGSAAAIAAPFALDGWWEGT